MIANPDRALPGAIKSLSVDRLALDAVSDPIRYRQFVIEPNNGSPYVDDDHGRRVAALNHWVRERH